MKSVLFPYSVYSIFIFLYTVLKNVDSFSNKTPLCCLKNCIMGHFNKKFALLNELVFISFFSLLELEM